MHKDTVASSVQVLSFSGTFVGKAEFTNIKDIEFKTDCIHWIHILSVSDVENIKALSGAFEICPLVIEDILDTNSLPKEEVESPLFNTINFFSRGLWNEF